MKNAIYSSVVLIAAKSSFFKCLFRERKKGGDDILESWKT